MRKDESGIIMIEAVIYFPLLIFAYLAFIVMSLYITQRVVLHMAVAETCLEAATWLGDDMKKYTNNSDYTKDPFSGLSPVKIQTNPYWNMIDGIGNYYHPMNENSFKKKIEEKVKARAGLGILTNETLKVTHEYNSYWVFGELIVNAEQELNFPLNLTIFGFKPDWHKWKLYATAKGMVFHTGSLINDVDFVFDFIRIITDGKPNMEEIKDFVGGLPSKLPS